MYVYKRSEPGLWTVGFYMPDDKWEPESDHDSREQAAARVAMLNGGRHVVLELLAACKELRDALAGAMRVIATSPEAVDRFVAEMAASGIQNGVGVRAAAAIEKAEGRS